MPSGCSGLALSCGSDRGGEDREGEEKVEGGGAWIDIVTGVSSGFLGGATERVSRQTLGPMYVSTNPARNAFVGKT